MRLDVEPVEALGAHEAYGVVMAAQKTMLSGETLAILKEGAQKCSDCAAILKSLEGENTLAAGWHADKTPFPVAAQRRHILETKGLALPAASVRFLRIRAGTCRDEGGSGCFYCARILEAMAEDGLLRDWPHDRKDEQVKLSVDDQRAHIVLEHGQPVEWEEVPCQS